MIYRRNSGAETAAPKRHRRKVLIPKTGFKKSANGSIPYGGIGRVYTVHTRIACRQRTGCALVMFRVAGETIMWNSRRQDYRETDTLLKSNER